MYQNNKQQTNKKQLEQEHRMVLTDLLKSKWNLAVPMQTTKS